MDLGTIWFVLWGVLWAVYFVLDGFDLGLGTLLPFMARDEGEKRIFYNAMGPFWDGNEVWLITAGGVTFAAFPTTYAVMFSGLYSALMLLLFALIVRGVCFEFRGKVESPGWKKLWDTCFFIGSFAPALLLVDGNQRIDSPLPQHTVIGGDALCPAISAARQAMDRYDPTVIGRVWDPSSPRIQLEPRGERGYIELRAVKAKQDG